MKTEIKYIIKPIAILVIVVVAFLISLYVGYGQITNLNNKISKEKETEKTLIKKVAILRRVNQLIPGDTTFLDVAMPSRGAILFGLNQVKNQANASGLLINNIKTTSATSVSDISENTITFSIDGDENTIYKFMETISKSLPLMNITKAQVSKSAESTNATMTIRIYTAALPKELPALNSAVIDLTESEIKTLSELQTFTMPTFTEPTQNVWQIEPKEDPFN